MHTNTHFLLHGKMGSLSRLCVGTGVKAEHVTEKTLKFINSFILQKQEAIKHIIVISS